MLKTGRDILHRWEGNPAITIEKVPFRANTVFNGSPIVTDNGIDLLMQVQGQQGHSFFVMARSKDGFRFKIDDAPVMLPAKDGPFAIYEKHGIEDPHITILEDTCYVVYTAVGDCGRRMALAKTEDRVNYERIAMISEPGNTNGILFPKKIGGRYGRLDSPAGNGHGGIWVSYSPDLIKWGDSRPVLSPRRGGWDEYRVGASACPIETEQGWLLIYHGTKMTPSGEVHRNGVALLENENPSKVIKRGESPILSPKTEYERIGDVINVCNICGAVVSKNGKMKIYYGAADSSICIGTCHIDNILEKGF
ncbi:MAG: glycoside hydrolase family 130 protein [Planctomycetes bacterium]|nr:glycoside hydrolase family 130 protein [Planctomycetota bacterium]